MYQTGEQTLENHCFTQSGGNESLRKSGKMLVNPDCKSVHSANVSEGPAVKCVASSELADGNTGCRPPTPSAAILGSTPAPPSPPPLRNRVNKSLAAPALRELMLFGGGERP